MTWCCVVSSVDRSGLCRVFESGLCRIRRCRVGSRSVGRGVELGCVVSPCSIESYYVSCTYTVWFGRVTSRVIDSYGLVWFGVEDWFTNRTVWCRVVSRVGRFVWCRVDRFGSVRFGSDWSSRVVYSIGSAYGRSATRSGCV
jgi:hypothetical protein